MSLTASPSKLEPGACIRQLTREEANRILGDAWWGGKHKGEPRRDRDYTSNDDGSGWILADVPLHRVRPNEEGDLYDGTANAERVREYVRRPISAPVHLSYGPRMVRRGAAHANVLDGGHRVSAARLRGDERILAIMQRSHFESLMAQ